MTERYIHTQNALLQLLRSDGKRAAEAFFPLEDQPLQSSSSCSPSWQHEMLSSPYTTHAVCELDYHPTLFHGSSPVLLRLQVTPAERVEAERRAMKTSWSRVEEETTYRAAHFPRRCRVAVSILTRRTEKGAGLDSSPSSSPAQMRTSSSSTIHEASRKDVIVRDWEMVPLELLSGGVAAYGAELFVPLRTLYYIVNALTGGGRGAAREPLPRLLLGLTFSGGSSRQDTREAHYIRHVRLEYVFPDSVESARMRDQWLRETHMAASTPRGTPPLHPPAALVAAAAPGDPLVLPSSSGQREITPSHALTTLEGTKEVEVLINMDDDSEAEEVVIHIDEEEEKATQVGGRTAAVGGKETTIAVPEEQSVISVHVDEEEAGESPSARTPSRCPPPQTMVMTTSGSDRSPSSWSALALSPPSPSAGNGTCLSPPLAVASATADHQLLERDVEEKARKGEASATVSPSSVEEGSYGASRSESSTAAADTQHHSHRMSSSTSSGRSRSIPRLRYAGSSSEESVRSPSAAAAPQGTDQGGAPFIKLYRTHPATYLPPSSSSLTKAPPPPPPPAAAGQPLRGPEDESRWRAALLQRLHRDSHTAPYTIPPSSAAAAAAAVPRGGGSGLSYRSRSAYSLCENDRLPPRSSSSATSCYTSPGGGRGLGDAVRALQSSWRSRRSRSSSSRWGHTAGGDNDGVSYLSGAAAERSHRRTRRPSSYDTYGSTPPSPGQGRSTSASTTSPSGLQQERQTSSLRNQAVLRTSPRSATPPQHHHSKAAAAMTPSSHPLIEHHSFFVWKHHATRPSVGHRILTVRREVGLRSVCLSLTLMKPQASGPPSGSDNSSYALPPLDFADDATWDPETEKEGEVLVSKHRGRGVSRVAFIIPRMISREERSTGTSSCSPWPLRCFGGAEAFALQNGLHRDRVRVPAHTVVVLLERRAMLAVEMMDRESVLVLCNLVSSSP